MKHNCIKSRKIGSVLIMASLIGLIIPAISRAGAKPSGGGGQSSSENQSAAQAQEAAVQQRTAEMQAQLQAQIEATRQQEQQRVAQQQRQAQQTAQQTQQSIQQLHDTFENNVASPIISSISGEGEGPGHWEYNETHTGGTRVWVPDPNGVTAQLPSDDQPTTEKEAIQTPYVSMPQKNVNVSEQTNAPAAEQSSNSQDYSQLSDQQLLDLINRLEAEATARDQDSNTALWKGALAAFGSGTLEGLGVSESKFASVGSTASPVFDDLMTNYADDSRNLAQAAQIDREKNQAAWDELIKRAMGQSTPPSSGLDLLLAPPAAPQPKPAQSGLDLLLAPVPAAPAK